MSIHHLFFLLIPLIIVIFSKLKTLKSLFLTICLSIPSLIFGVEVCQIPSGCQIDDKGICTDCLEIDEEDTEEYKLQKKFEEDKEKIAQMKAARKFKPF